MSYLSSEQFGGVEIHGHEGRAGGGAPLRSPEPVCVATFARRVSDSRWATAALADSKAGQR
jgi:hypothetical protein